MCQACRNKALELGRLYEQTVGVDDIIAKAVGSSYPSRMAAKEVAFRRYLEARWNALIPEAVRAAEAVARSDQSPKAADKIAEAVGRVMREWEADIKAKMKDFVLEMYWLAREAGWKQGTRQVKGRLAYSVPKEKADIQKAKRKVEVIPTWNVNDRDTTEALQEHQLFWIGDHYDDKVSNAIADRAREKLVEGHLRPSEAGKAIGDTVREELSWVTTPDGYRGTAEQYFEALTANAATTARAFGQVNSFEELGITKIEIFNPDDERTCEICSWMNGKVFTVEQARGIMDAELEAKNPDAVRNAHPWISDSTGGMDRLKELSAGAGLQGPGDAAGLAEAGIVLPPFHFQCRCSVEVSEEAGSFLSVPDAEPERPKPERAPRPPKVPKPPKQAEPTGARPESFPEIPDGPAKPMAMFNKERANNALKDVSFEGKVPPKLSDETQKVLRQEFNALCAENGMVSTDITRKGGDQAEILVKNLKKGPQKDCRGFHTTDSGSITLQKQTAIDLKVGLRRLAEGQEVGTQGRSGLETMLHETIHGHSPLAGWEPGKGSAYSGIGVAVEEATVQAATKRMLNLKFGIEYEARSLYDDAEFIGRFKQAIEESVLEAAEKTFGKEGPGLSKVMEFMAEWEKIRESAKSKDLLMDMLGDAGIRMRRTKILTNNPDDLLKGMAEAMELPPELTAGMSAEQAENIAADFMNAMEKNGRTAAEKAKAWLDKVTKRRRRKSLGVF